jgi:hypothetical protein
MQHLISNRTAGTNSNRQGETVSDLDAFRKPDSYARRFAPERAAMLPGMKDLYKAAGYADSETNRLVLVMGRHGFRIGGTAYVFLQYMYIGTVELGFTEEGQVFRFVLSDTQPKLVTVHGQNLVQICDDISRRRLQWIREAGQDFTAPVSSDDPVITCIDIRDWQPEENYPDNLIPDAA